MTRILCTGDLHIGAGTNHRVDALADQAKTLAQIATLAFDRDVDLVLIAGDVFHRPKPNPAELHVFARFTRALEALQVPAIAILGNAGHDQWGVDQPTALELFASPWLRVSRVPELIRAAGDVAVCTLPSVPVHRLVASQGGGDRGEIYQAAAELLVETVRGLRTDAPEGWPCVMLGHWSVSGASLPSGLPVADLHEPVLDLGALEQIGFDAIVLGHIHHWQQIATNVLEPELPVFYTSSPLCLSFGEGADPHGCVLLEVDPVGKLPEFVPLTGRRFVTVDVDLMDALSLDLFNGDGLDPTDFIAAELGDSSKLEGAVVRIRYRATEAQHRRVDQAALRALVLDAGAHKLYQIVPDIIRESRARAEHVDETLGPLEAVSAWTVANEISSESAQALDGLTVELLGAAA